MGKILKELKILKLPKEWWRTSSLQMLKDLKSKEAEALVALDVLQEIL